MCRPVTCRLCSKTTWAGCGAHVDQVMRDVPEAKQCTCRSDMNSGRNDSRSTSLMGRLFGR